MRLSWYGGYLVANALLFIEMSLSDYLITSLLPLPISLSLSTVTTDLLYPIFEV